MASKEGGKCMLTNSESDSEAAPSLALVEKYSLDGGRQVRKRNKALQVRFKDICEAQNEQREAALQAAAAGGGKPVAYRAAYRKYMTVPARRSIPNVTRSTGVQTSPDLKKRYQTFPFERKKGQGHAVRHAASYKDQNNGFLLDGRQQEEEEEAGEGPGGRGGRVQRTRALLHTSERGAAGARADSACSDTAVDAAVPIGCDRADPDRLTGAAAASRADYQLCSVRPRTGRGSQRRERQEAEPERARDVERSSAKRHLLRPEDEEEEEEGGGPSRTSGVTGPISWNSLTQVECPDSPAAATRGKRKKASQLNGLQSQTLPRAASCTTQAQCHAGPFSPPPRRQRPLSAAEEERGAGTGAGGACRDSEAGASGSGGRRGEACKQIVPVTKEGDVKAQLQAMESLISSSQETIKVLLGVIQELEKGEAHREGLSYRTGQDTANCDTCRNSACIIYSVELDFKQQEDKLQPLMKRLCPTDDAHLSSLPYPQEAFTSTPKRKSKAESKKHARWKLWFL